jgi:ribonuclease VapC
VIVDSSALIAILMREPDGPRYAAALSDAESPALSAVSFVETTMVAEGRGGPAMGAELDALLAEARIETVPVDRAQAERARAAWRRFGKGRHPAALNLGDCFAYALAAERGEALLFKGADFARTDVKAAL